MPPERWHAPAWRKLAWLLCFAAFLPADAAALRVVNYNIMLYPSVNVAGRNPYFQIVMSPLGADVVVVQELNNATGITQFRDNVLNVLEPGQWSSAAYTSGPDTNNGLFYKASEVTLLGSWAWIPPDNLRQVNCYRLRPAGYSNAELRIYSLHLKAGNSSADEQRRLTDAIGIRDSLNAVPPGTHVILTGDFNVYRSSDLSFQKFLESQADNDGRVYDPLNAVGSWQDNPAFATIHTQCPSTTSYRPSGSYAGGGIDDRFDMFLPTYNMGDGEGLDLLVPTYVPIGNDGQHLNLSITDPPLAADTSYSRALWWASDHLPVRVDLQLPAKISVPASLALGTVIVGGGAALTVSNPAVAPADELSLTFTPPAGFTAPASGAVNPGSSEGFAIGTAPGAPGPRSGNLTLGTDDPDQPSVVVAVDADVLDHAEASLDSLAVLLADTLDFGTHAAGAFPTLLARVHNRGHDALQARLALATATINGGEGRFSIAGGFAPALVGGTAASHGIQFDAAGATLDSLYEASLTFASADEPLPGALAQPDLVVTLRARPASGTVGVPVGPQPPAFTRLYPPMPNPLRGASTLRFDLAAGARVTLEVFDLSGRRVATMAHGWLEAGAHRFTWDGRTDGGAKAGPGLYFVRLDGAGFERSTRLVVMR